MAKSMAKSMEKSMADMGEIVNFFNKDNAFVKSIWCRDSLHGVVFCD
jgi:hypothetical protein